MSEESQYKSTLFSQSINADGEAGGDVDKDVDPPWTFNAGFNSTRAVSDNPGGAPIVDITKEFSLGGGWRDRVGPGVDLQLISANTPQEQLVTRGGTLSPSYRWEYGGGHKGGEDSSSFKPYFEIKVNFADTNYLESFSGSVRNKKILRPVSGTAELLQGMYGVKLTWKPAHDWRFSLETDHYSYNRDVTQFQNQLDSPAALLRGISGFSSTVGGLPRTNSTASIAWGFADNWKDTLTMTGEIAALDGSLTTLTKDTFEYKISGQWRTTFGAEWEKGGGVNDAIGILGFEWDSP